VTSALTHKTKQRERRVSKVRKQQQVVLSPSKKDIILLIHIIILHHQQHTSIADDLDMKYGELGKKSVSFSYLDGHKFCVNESTLLFRVGSVLTQKHRRTTK
jgi:hypothetical protein